MGRILVDLSDGQLDALAVIVETQHRPRAAIIRDAIDAYIALNKPRLADDVFGLWKDRTIDGLAYQEELRSEW
ncbi:ribbon-helix-helix protein, CopG family [Burkholderia sp. BCCIQ04A]|uniref:Ribbon-helix-helix protein, CopG family n=1 Tax=Burkholderia anthinoferrum TaxID=3090833 RepID=A0ABU5WT48_9BURK|nr:MULTISPECIES: ribbon-helix-helix protein, CopG family [Burkholderia]MEB2507445.1 ribbon-helix-helix protein, CopG family [Burkholderia anthinoferrum]MEB2535199.1 ribbon-helix-helix protein, CopG family [Burkholderia anthinoferrum]MEB2565217.1 ribbon-helix-helix protein, CopG family [Burkholderia anthinoferrum]MEB2582176.1 ribbon-helix-helix protein, CopG family [Burkholderia anthinoferrum]MCA8032460.1 ribbon-helix-helix protein, CopG family [Burkholderia arboris]